MPPPLAVSLGDPAGVGPELIAEAYVRRHEERLPPFFVCGGLEAVLEAARTRGHSISATRLERPPAGLGGMGDALPFLGEMTAGYRPGTPYADRAGYFVPVDGPGVVNAAGVPVGVTTCWEVIFDRAARESVLNGAQLLAVPTNNATFNEAMSRQQLAFARLRAVEHDRYVVVAGTTGISAVIAPDGRELARTEFFEPAYLDTQVRMKSQLTPATRWAPLVEGVLVAVGLGALIAAILHNGSFVRRLRTTTKDRGAK